MAQLKTRKNDTSVKAFLDSLKDEERKKDAYELLKIFEEVTKEKPVLWGTAIIGFGEYHYKSEKSAQEGDWFITGFSPRVTNLTIYIIPGFKDYEKQLAKLGEFKTSVSCLYVKKLSDIDTKVLKEIIKDSIKVMKKKYP